MRPAINHSFFELSANSKSKVNERMQNRFSCLKNVQNAFLNLRERFSNDCPNDFKAIDTLIHLKVMHSLNSFLLANVRNTFLNIPNDFKAIGH